MKERLYEILRKPKEFLRDGEKLILEKDGVRVILLNNGEELSVLEETLDTQSKVSIIAFMDIIRQQKCYKINCPSCDENFAILENLKQKKQRFKGLSDLEFCYRCGQELDWD